uniref:Uncharacterized protein n=1 Tax=Coccidioides posadasii RMSCC 3488 TaxID=454284 RepID=A0A0J6F6F4_COCPO|nr:hypothetical protein CPAG_00886 [Coccidioides posadasii RMSCC 3488]
MAHPCLGERGPRVGAETSTRFVPSDKKVGFEIEQNHKRNEGLFWALGSAKGQNAWQGRSHKSPPGLLRKSQMQKQAAAPPADTSKEGDFAALSWSYIHVSRHPRTASSEPGSALLPGRVPTHMQRWHGSTRESSSGQIYEKA